MTVAFEPDPQHWAERSVVTAAQMQAIEARLFSAGMPVAALMEKVAGRVAGRIQALYPNVAATRVGVLVGPGHNGGDALVIARELHCQGCSVCWFCPFTDLKPLTQQHADYVTSLGLPRADSVEALRGCTLLVDGFFGMGLRRSLTGPVAEAIEQINQWPLPVLSIDLPSGLDTDTGAVLGAALKAHRSFCLGLWKRAFLQDQALDYVGVAERVDFDIPTAVVEAVLGAPVLQRVTAVEAIAALPLPRPVTLHKYQAGHLLLVCGSRQYAGAALLAAQAARASGVGMLSVAVPQALTGLVVAQVPEALVLGCPETEMGAIAELPAGLDLSQYQAIACGCGLTPAAGAVVQQVLAASCPLLLDADALNSLATLGLVQTLAARSAATVLTPHPGEFKRLFPGLAEGLGDRLEAARLAAQQCQAIVLLKGARTVIADPQQTRVIAASTPALARGGSGDVLSGLMGGLLAQPHRLDLLEVVAAAAWWHAEAAQQAAGARSDLGVDASTLIATLLPTLAQVLKQSAGHPI